MKFFTTGHKRRFIIVVALVGVVLLIAGYLRKDATPISVPDNIPQDVYEFLISYLETCKNDPDSSVSYCHFEEEFEKGAYIRSYIEIVEYDILDASAVSENLYAFNVHMERADAEFSRDYYFFVGKIDNQLYLMNNVYNIPEDMRAAINDDDFSMYTYGGQLISSSDLLQ